MYLWQLERMRDDVMKNPDCFYYIHSTSLHHLHHTVISLQKASDFCSFFFFHSVIIMLSSKSTCSNKRKRWEGKKKIML